METRSNIRFLLRKWAELSVRSNHPDIYTLGHLGLIESEVSLYIDDEIENVYINLQKWYQIDLKTSLNLNQYQSALQVDIRSTQKPK